MRPRLVADAHLSKTYLLAAERAPSVSRQSVAEEKSTASDRLPALKGATLAYNDTDAPALHEIDFRPVVGGLTLSASSQARAVVLIALVLGHVGSGKSAILLGLLDELRMVAGEVSNHGLAVAYAAQEPWLQSALTVRSVRAALALG